MTKWVENKSVKFETQADIWRYLLDGWAIKSKSGQLHFIENGKTNLCGFSYYHPEEWMPMKKEEWYKDIPEQGVLCLADGQLVLIHLYKEGWFYSGQGGMYKDAIPLTKKEVIKYIYET